jgi:phosphatidylserine decarboxylase
MSIRSLIARFVQQEDVNFLFTNCLPRRSATRLTGWFAGIDNPLVCGISLWIWRLFTDLDLSEAEAQKFRSLQHCFTRRLKPGARPIDGDPAVLVSPCDGIVGAAGAIEAGRMLQVKGSFYALADLLGDAALAAGFGDGQYVTLRLTSAMYHHFHAPHDLLVEQVTHIPGDVWNVNPATLRRVERLFCRNERAVIRTTLSAGGYAITLVPVAAILVAGIRLGFLDLPRGRERSSTRCGTLLNKGEPMGWFEHGSTIIVLAPAGFALAKNLVEGMNIRVGEPLMRLPAAA